MGNSGHEHGLIERLREEIRASGLSLAKLGDRTGIHHTRLSRFLNGKRSLSLEAAATIFAALGLRVVKGASGEADAPPAETGAGGPQEGEQPAG